MKYYNIIMLILAFLLMFSLVSADILTINTEQQIEENYYITNNTVDHSLPQSLENTGGSSNNKGGLNIFFIFIASYLTVIILAVVIIFSRRRK